MASDHLAQLLAGYAPRTADEERDLARIQAVVNNGDPWSRGNPLHVTGSALIVHPSTQRVLLRWHARQQAWLQVGGHADPGETDPLAVALREGEEETGLADLTPWPTADILHVVVVPVPAGKGEPAHEHADVRFVLATNIPDSAVPETPTAALRWLSLEEAHTATTEPNMHETFARVANLFG